MVGRGTGTGRAPVPRNILVSIILEYVEFLKIVMSNRTEFIIVISLAFGYFILGSLFSVFHSSAHSIAFSESALVSLMTYEVIIFLALSGFLIYRGWTPGEIGLKPHLRDVAAGFGLAVFAYVLYYTIYNLVAPFMPHFTHTRPTGAGLTLLSVILVSLINPLFEEVFVCGYVINYFKRSKRGFWFAVNTSVALRLSYHLYQGAQGVVSIVPLGLVFTLWFARTGQLWPVIVAHAIFDFAALVPFALPAV